MKFCPRSVLFQVLGAVAAVFLLAGCDDADLDLPHVWGANEVPPEVENAPRAVEKPAPGQAQSEGWPRVGDVPFKPKDFTSQPLIDESKRELEAERDQGQTVIQQYDQTLPPACAKPDCPSELGSGLRSGEGRPPGASAGMNVGLGTSAFAAPAVATPSPAAPLTPPLLPSAKTR